MRVYKTMGAVSRSVGFSVAVSIENSFLGYAFQIEGYYVCLVLVSVSALARGFFGDQR